MAMKLYSLSYFHLFHFYKHEKAGEFLCIYINIDYGIITSDKDTSPIHKCVAIKS